ncbi:MAG TPA: OmpA family protein [Candidatus Angelobacter sp.]|nr:OmpA family protein [Candidatus Angelobacter sp.]
MKNFKLAPVVLAGMVLSAVLSCLGFSQQPQPAQPQPAQTQPAQPQPVQPALKAQEHAANLDVGNTPTRSDMYCSGFLTSEKVSDKLFVAAGHNSPDQTRFAGASDTIFIHGQGMKEGDRYQIVREVKDTNHYEIFPGQRSALRNTGVPYVELAIVKITDVQKSTGIASFELSCADVMPGDLAIPLVEREAPPFRKVTLDRYTPPTGKPQGRIVMAKEFDSFLGSKYKAYLNIGADKGLKPGDYLRATRTYSSTYHDPVAGLSLDAKEYDDTQKDPHRLPSGEISSLPRRTLGDMIVLNVQRKSATAMILTALEDITVGDGVEVMDISDAPVLAPISPAFSNAPQPDAANATTTPPKINCSASPTSLRAGESASITCEAVSPDNRPVNITYVANGGKLSSNRNQATLDTTDSGPGPIAVRATAFDDRQLSASTVVTVNVEAAAPAAPTAQKLMELDYKPNSGYVDNRSKAVLDDVALKMQQDPNLNAVLYGSADSGEPRSLGLQRAQNAMAYLTKSKGIDPQRIQAKAATEPGRKVEVWTLPAGATLPGTTPTQPPQGTGQQEPPQTTQPQTTQPPAAEQPPALQPPASTPTPADQPTASPQPTPPPQGN